MSPFCRIAIIIVNDKRQGSAVVGACRVAGSSFTTTVGSLFAVSAGVGRVGAGLEKARPGVMQKPPDDIGVPLSAHSAAVDANVDGG